MEDAADDDDEDATSECAHCLSFGLQLIRWQLDVCETLFTSTNTNVRRKMIEFARKVARVSPFFCKYQTNNVVFSIFNEVITNAEISVI